jgi:hypothetical protein
MKSLGVIRFEADSLTVIFDGLLMPAKVVVCNSPVIVCLGIIRLKI